jgi:tetratricopeptide (TPR) repeat protein
VRPARLVVGGALVVLLATLGCRRDVREPGAGGSDPLAEAKALLDERRFDEVIARLGETGDAESLYLLGRAWAGKAEAAPVPTPAPGSTVPAASLLKPEEERALSSYERAVAARPDLARAHLAIAELLAPHSLAMAAATRGRGAPPAGGTDLSVDRVLRSFGEAVQADPAGTVAAEAMIRFATAAGRAAEAEAGFQELVRRRREEPDLLVRYGDFLAGAAGKPEDALAQYAQALIWRPDDTATRLKMADIHLAAASALLGDRQYAASEARLKEARRFAVDPASPQVARLREIESRLREIRGR